MKKRMYHENRERGITLLITLLLMGVLLGVSTSLLNITLKQYQLAGITLASEKAFQAANAGLECMLFNDFPDPELLVPSPFDVPGNGTEQAVIPAVSCFGSASQNATDNSNLPGFIDPNIGNGRTVSGGEQLFQFDFVFDSGEPENRVCSEVSIYKFFSDSTDVPVEVDGKEYRSSDCPAGSVCTVVQSRGYNVSCAQIDTNPRVVEREYTQVY